jgi:hypothetical protein
VWIVVCSLGSIVDVLMMFISKSSSLITFINLWMEDYVWNQNKLCRRQQQMETSSMKNTSKFDFMSNFQKVFLSMPKAFSKIEWPFLFPYIV